MMMRMRASGSFSLAVVVFWKTTDGTRRRATSARPDVESIFSKEHAAIYEMIIA
jgi:hypothetical protein